MAAVHFVVGNSYNGTKPGGKREWICYADFFDGDVDLVLRVKFKISPRRSVGLTRKVHCPMKLQNGRWRFQVAHQAFNKPERCAITIIGVGGSIQKKTFTICAGRYQSDRCRFFEKRPNHPLRPVPVPDIEFGVELELSTASDISIGDVAALIRNKAGVDVNDMMDNYKAACLCNDVWVIMTDGSLVCSRDMPGCNRFELKSPILIGGDGLREVDSVFHALKDIYSSLHVNSTMGYHVHVNIERLSKFRLASVCQNFIKYEKAMDAIMPPSRTNGNYFCKSNMKAIGATEGYNHDVKRMIGSCNSKEDIVEVMCPSDKYYKLNLRPFLGRQPTIEFRQHSSTYNKTKIKNWIRYCLLFVDNSARAKPPSPLRKEVDDDELLEILMTKVVKDRYLHNYYQGRRLKFLEQTGSDDCCEGCGLGERCVARRTKLNASTLIMN